MSQASAVLYLKLAFEVLRVIFIPCWYSGLRMRHTLQFHLGLRVDGSTSVVCSCISPNLTTQKGSLLPFRSLACRSAASTTVIFKRPMLPLSVCMSGKKREHREVQARRFGFSFFPFIYCTSCLFSSKVHTRSILTFLFSLLVLLLLDLHVLHAGVYNLFHPFVPGGGGGEGRGERKGERRGRDRGVEERERG